MATHNDLGKEGEKLALNYLQKKGFQILENNWRYLKAEIDIIAVTEKFLVIVEVKTRNNNYFGNPEEFVSQKKIKLLVTAANEYVVSNNLDMEVRFDIISVILNKKETKITHLENAFLHF